MSYAQCPRCQGLWLPGDDHCRMCGLVNDPDPIQPPFAPPPDAPPEYEGWAPPPMDPRADPRFGPPSPGYGPPPGSGPPPAGYGPPPPGAPGYGPSPYAPGSPGYGPPGPGYHPPGPPSGPGAPGPSSPYGPQPGAPLGYGPPAPMGTWGYAPPAAPKRGNGGRAVALGLAFALVLAAAAFALVRSRGPSYPSEWDARVLPIAEWVAGQRGLAFERPVYVDFLPEEEFRAKVEEPVTDPDEEDRTAAEDSEAYFRSLGLVQGDVDLLAGSKTLKGSGTLAFYSPVTKRVTVRGTELTASVRVTLAHELTHVLQDQQFGLDVSDSANLGGEVIRALAEGDAVHIEQAFIDSLSTADREAYQREQEAGLTDFANTTSGVPDVLQAAYGAPYILGEPFIDFLYMTKGPTGVNEVFRSPPSSLAAMADPLDYLRGAGLVEVTAPTATGQTLFDGRFDAVDLFLMLAARIDPHQALTAIDLWAGDSYVAARNGGSVCTDLTIAARANDTDVDDAAAGAQLGAILETWRAAMPAEAGATVTVTGRQVAVHTCDPGATADQKIVGAPSEAMTLVVNRIFAMARAMQDGATPVQAKCAADGFAATYTVAELRSGTGFDKDEALRRLAEAQAACPA